MALKQLIEPLVTLEPISHRYFDTSQNEYMSVSKFTELFEVPFDSKNISWACAKKELKAELGREPFAQEIQVRQQAILFKWEQKNKLSTGIGTEIHNAIEDFVLTGNDNPKWPFIREMCSKLFVDYMQVFPETCVYSKTHYLAGTMDLPGYVRKNTVFIDDWKTNMAHGITYEDKYKGWFTDPVSHLEACSYTEYCLKMSLYAYMLEQHGYKIGRMRLIYIPPENPEKWHTIPVPYMRGDVVNMISYATHYKMIHVQPKMISV